MDKLIETALRARERAHAPYSQFLVGAAVEASDGTIFSGCNIENCTYGLTICAERVAIFKAVSEGFNNLIRICVAADSIELTPPCGPCRQIIWEFCENVPVVMVNLKGDQRIVNSADLMPLPFDHRKLRKP